jgi:hypothetical protein
VSLASFNNRFNTFNCTSAEFLTAVSKNAKRFLKYHPIIVLNTAIAFVFYRLEI